MRGPHFKGVTDRPSRPLKSCAATCGRFRRQRHLGERGGGERIGARRRRRSGWYRCRHLTARLNGARPDRLQFGLLQHSTSAPAKAPDQRACVSRAAHWLAAALAGTLRLPPSFAISHGTVAIGRTARLLATHTVGWSPRLGFARAPDRPLGSTPRSRASVGRRGPHRRRARVLPCGLDVGPKRANRAYVVPDHRKVALAHSR